MVLNLLLICLNQWRSTLILSFSDEDRATDSIQRCTSLFTFTLDNNCWFLEASLASLIEIIDRVFDRLWLHLIWNIYLKHWHTRTH
jgi:hypothetical protein